MVAPINISLLMITMHYGPEVVIGKIECIGHIQKIMGSRLWRLKTIIKGKIRRWENLFGKGQPTKEAIQQIQTFYGLAIRRKHSIFIYSQVMKSRPINYALQMKQLGVSAIDPYL